MCVILCGLPGCGKTSLGELFAAKMSWEFLDTDSLVEELFKRDGKKYCCREIFQLFGEKYFRGLENRVVLSLKVGDAPKVIATGGGTMLDPENLQFLKALGKIVYLKGAPATLFERALANGIPAYLKGNDPFGSFLRLAKAREPLYERVADHKIDVDKSLKEQIIQSLCSYGGNLGK